MSLIGVNPEEALENVRRTVLQTRSNDDAPHLRHATPYEHIFELENYATTLIEELNTLRARASGFSVSTFCVNFRQSFVAADREVREKLVDLIPEDVNHRMNIVLDILKNSREDALDVQSVQSIFEKTNLGDLLAQPHNLQKLFIEVRKEHIEPECYALLRGFLNLRPENFFTQNMSMSSDYYVDAGLDVNTFYNTPHGPVTPLMYIFIRNSMSFQAIREMQYLCNVDGVNLFLRMQVDMTNYITYVWSYVPRCTDPLPFIHTASYDYQEETSGTSAFTVCANYAGECLPRLLGSTRNPEDMVRALRETLLVYASVMIRSHTFPATEYTYEFEACKLVAEHTRPLFLQEILLRVPIFWCFSPQIVSQLLEIISEEDRRAYYMHCLRCMHREAQSGRAPSCGLQYQHFFELYGKERKDVLRILADCYGLNTWTDNQKRYLWNCTLAYMERHGVTFQDFIGQQSSV